MSRHVRARQICAQLLCANSTSSPSTTLTLLNARVVRSEQLLTHGGCQTRSYAAPRAPRPSKKGPSYTEVYTLEDIPANTFEDVKKSGSFERLSAPEYYEVAKRFAEAIKSGSSPWNVKLTGHNLVSASTLYEVGCLMRHIRESRNAQAFSIAMWASAAEMGSRTASVSLARHIIRSGAWGQKSQMKNIETRFKQLVSEGKDPNALTVEGEHLYELGKYDAAANMLRRALDLGEDDFEWKSLCQLYLGRSYLKLKRPTEAREVFEALSESGSAEADADLGQLLRSSDIEKAEQHLYTAAINSNPETFRHLSEIAFENMSRATDEYTRKDQQRWAMEWSRLADPKVQF